MAELVLKNVEGYWQGNDYKDVAAKKAQPNKPAQPAISRHVSVTSVAVGPAAPFAFVFMTHMNIDMDGAGNAYGPENKETLDHLPNAGRGTHYYGLMSVKPAAGNQPNKDGMMLAPDKTKVKVDPGYPDAQGFLPVVQQSGTYAGYFVSTTSKTNPNGSASIWEQSHYLDANAVSYYALSGGMKAQGFRGDNFGLALRLDTFATASFAALDGEGSPATTDLRVGECSYKVFLDIGGKPKRKRDPWPDNNFDTCFVLCPRSNVSALGQADLADNPRDLAAFIALQARLDAKVRGVSAVDAFKTWVGGGRKEDPLWPTDRIIHALSRYGYGAKASGRHRDVPSVVVD